jgi:hypothetical protein
LPGLFQLDEIIHLLNVIPGRVEDEPEIQGFPMCYCTSELWSFGTIPE